MTAHPVHYQLPKGWSLEDLKGRLTESNPFVESENPGSSFIYLDSFDWRLWQAGAELVLEEQPKGHRLCWIDHRSGVVEGSLPLAAPPDFPAALPKGPLRKRLQSVLEMRVLIPLVKVEQRTQVLSLVDDEEKTVLRLLLQSSRYSSLDGALSGELDERLELVAIKGYPDPLLQMQSQLKSLGLEAERQSYFEAALAGIGRRPMDYTSKLNYLLDPEARSDKTTKLILLSLLNTLEANVEGAKSNLDSEFLHDLRVATRRSRSAMTQIKGVFEEEALAPFKKGLSWLGQVTGPTRDMDVYLLKYKGYRKSLPSKVRKDLDPFHDFLVAHHKQSQKELVRKLNSPHFRKLMKDYRAWLEEPVPNVSFLPNAVRPIAAVADERIAKIYKKVLKDGKAIKSNTHAEALHDLRKDCKKLRYLMEFFQSLYPKPEIRGLISQLKALLDNLGDFQDLQVQAESLEALGKQMQEEGAPASCLMAMGILVGNLLQRQEQARTGFADLFAQFSAEENDQAFRRLFGVK